MVDAGWIHGLKVVAIAKRKAIAILALVVTLLWQTAYTQVGIILLSHLLVFSTLNNKLKMMILEFTSLSHVSLQSFV